MRRYIEAQTPHWPNVQAELRAGRKTTHWMWFVFPQIAGLGESGLSKKYALSGLDEARAYWQHPVLGARLKTCIEIMLSHVDRFTPQEVLGGLEAIKLKSCLTLFAQAVPDEPLFQEAIDTLYAGQTCQPTLTLLKTRHR